MKGEVCDPNCVLGNEQTADESANLAELAKAPNEPWERFLLKKRPSLSIGRASAERDTGSPKQANATCARSRGGAPGRRRRDTFERTRRKRIVKQPRKRSRVDGPQIDEKPSNLCKNSDISKKKTESRKIEDPGNRSKMEEDTSAERLRVTRGLRLESRQK